MALKKREIFGGGSQLPIMGGDRAFPYINNKKSGGMRRGFGEAKSEKGMARSPSREGKKGFACFTLHQETCLMFRHRRAPEEDLSLA